MYWRELNDLDQLQQSKHRHDIKVYINLPAFVFQQSTRLPS